MQDSHNGSPLDYPGLLSDTASVTFVSDQTAVPSTTMQQPVLTTQSVASTTIPTVQATTVATTSPVAKKTTYAGLPAVLAVAGIFGAAAVAFRKK